MNAYIGNSGPGPVLPRRADDHVPRTPTVIRRREQFANLHPEVDVRARRVGGVMTFFVREPGQAEPVAWTDPSAMMDDLEKRYPR